MNVNNFNKETMNNDVHICASVVSSPKAKFVARTEVTDSVQPGITKLVKPPSGLH